MRHEKDIIDEVDSGRIKIFSPYNGAIQHRRTPDVRDSVGDVVMPFGAECTQYCICYC